MNIYENSGAPTARGVAIIINDKYKHYVTKHKNTDGVCW